MIHQYKLNGYNIVLDVFSGAIHIVDEVAYDIISLYKDFSKEEIVKKIKEQHNINEEEVLECLEDIHELEKNGKLLCEDCANELTSPELLDFLDCINLKDFFDMLL